MRITPVFLLLMLMVNGLQAQYYRVLATMNSHCNITWGSGEEGIQPGFGITLSMETNRGRKWDFATVYQYGEYTFESADTVPVDPAVYRYQHSAYALAIRSKKFDRFVFQVGAGAGALFETEEFYVPYYNPATGTVTGVEIDSRDLDNVIFPVMAGAGVDLSPSFRLVARCTAVLFPWGDTASVSGGPGVVWTF
jgi:hypothetical protein